MEDKGSQPKKRKAKLIPIPEYEELYSMNCNGEIYSNYRKRFLKPWINGSGYLHIELTKNKICKTYKIHRLLAQLFLENPENKKYINHKNGIKNDNRLENLEWCTSSENQKHAYDTGLKRILKGEDSVCNKLTEKDVREIKKLLKETNLTQKQIGARFGVLQPIISAIKVGKRWDHVR